jgi:tetraacyldisaccharide 4'-kinase
MRAALQRAWLRRGALARVLLPLSWLYGAVVAERRMLYRAGVLRSSRPARPVIVVGNVIAGGAGKTPIVMAVVDHLRERGIRAGVVSRGYGRRSSGCLEVLPQSDAAQAGDEPLLIRRLCGVPVFVGEKRVEAAAALLAAHPRTQVIVSDDGLQHLAMDRDLEICVFDERGIGNGWLLPAGPLRERWPREVDLVLRPPAQASLGGFFVERTLANEAIDASGTRIPLALLRGVALHAVAGIANPEAFFAMLLDEGLTLAKRTALPDHADYAGVSFEAAERLVCTEKDAAKLWRHRPDALAVPLKVAIDPAFRQALDRLVDAKLSSAHGSETA